MPSKNRFWIVSTVFMLLLICTLIFLEQPTDGNAPRILASYLVVNSGDGKEQDDPTRRPIPLPFSEQGSVSHAMYEYIVELEWEEGANTRFRVVPDAYLKSITANGQLIPEDRYSESGRIDSRYGLIVDFGSFLRSGKNELLFRIASHSGKYGMDLSGHNIPSGLQSVTMLLLILLFCVMIFKAFWRIPAYFGQSPIAYKVFFFLFAVFFAWILALSLFDNPYGLGGLLPVITIVIVIPMVLGMWKVLGRLELTERQGRRMLFGAMAVMAAAQFVIGYWLCSRLGWDMEFIFNGGRLLALTDTLEHSRPRFGLSYLDYYAAFPHQYGGLFLYRCLFSVWHFFGGTDWHMAALLYNVAILQLMVFAIYSATKRLIGVRGGVFAIFLLGIFLPFYAMSAVYYTDVFSMPFVAFVFAVYLRAKAESCIRKKLVLFALVGVLAAIGALLKFTVFIVLIATIFDLFLSNRSIRTGAWRMCATCIGIMIFVAAALFVGFRGYMDAKADSERVDRRRINTLLFMLSGLSGHTAYSHMYFEYAWSIPDLATREKRIMSSLKKRIFELGASGMLQVAQKKAVRNFSIGTRVHEQLSFEPVRKNRLHELIADNGRRFQSYETLSTSIWCAFWLFMLVGAVLHIRKPCASIVPWLSVFGLLLFSSFLFETNPRYMSNFLPMAIFGSALAMSAISDRFKVFR